MEPAVGDPHDVAGILDDLKDSAALADRDVVRAQPVDRGRPVARAAERGERRRVLWGDEEPALPAVREYLREYPGSNFGLKFR